MLLGLLSVGSPWSIAEGHWLELTIGDLQASEPVQGIRVRRAKPWAESAIGTVDTFVKEGNLESALSSCEAMVSNSQLPAALYLRHAVLKLFTPGKETDVDTVLHLLNRACASGCELHPKELGAKSIQVYFKPTDIPFDQTLDALSKIALDESELAVGNLLLIASLLKLDGQPERAKVFAQEAFDRAAATGELQWNSLLVTLLR